MGISSPSFAENIWKAQCNLESGYLESKLIRLIKDEVTNFRAARVDSQQLLLVEPEPGHELGHRLAWGCCEVGQAKQLIVSVAFIGLCSWTVVKV